MTSYLKAGYLLHLVCLIEVALAECLFYSIDIKSWLDHNHVFLKILALSPAIILPLVAQLDARSRYQNYKLIKDLLHIYGFQTKILKPFIKSSCQREAAKTAASELGMLPQCKEYFRAHGYRWFHLLPDAVSAKPSVLLTKNFWVTTLFEKTYHSKVQFEKNRFFAFTNLQTLLNTNFFSS